MDGGRVLLSLWSVFVCCCRLFSFFFLGEMMIFFCILWLLICLRCVNLCLSICLFRVVWFLFV